MRCSKICALLVRKFSSAAIHSVFDYTEDRTMRDKIKLVSSAGTGHYYTTDKNKKNTPDKMEIKKYDPVVRKHVIYKEGKIK